MKNILFTIFIWMYGVFAIGQTPEENILKYWKYRDRLKQNFMIGIGPDWGNSLPASERILQPGQPGVIKWGDATIYLSQYIALLATEYTLLSTWDQNTEETIRELFYALYALNRLDLRGEPAFQEPASLNGFFIRDDVTPSMINLPNFYNKVNQNLPAYQHVSQIESDYTAANIYSKEMSKDQVIWIMMAMRLVTKYLPNGLAYYENGQPMGFQVTGNTNIRQEAKNITERIISYMRKDNPMGWTWIIRNPHTNMPVTRGYNALALSWGFGGAYTRITNNFITVSGNSAIATALSAKTLWKFLAFHQLPYNTDEDFKIELLNAIANLWDDGNLNTNPNKNALNSWRLGIRCFAQDNLWVPYVHKLIWDSGIPLYSYYYFIDALNNCRCDNIFNYGFGYYGSLEFSSNSLLVHPRDIGDLTPIYPGDYNGLDYMLIHNMFYLTYSEFLPPYLRKFDSDITPSFSINNPAPYNFGHLSNPLTLMSWDNIVASNTIYTNSDVIYRASTYIDLLEGFETNYPTSFTALVDPVECMASGGIERLTEGGVSYWEEATIPEDTEKNKLSGIIVFPNPVENMINVIVQDDQSVSQLYIFDIHGKMRMVKRIVKNREIQQIDVSGLIPGVYFIKVDNNYSKIIKL
jgi:hypothetical protein